MTTYRVLVVDDEEDFLDTILSRLKKRKVEVSGAKNGIEALKMIEKFPYDVVILDIKMPGGMDGIDVLREIKKLQPLAEVILLTGHASIETSIEGMKHGAFDYLLKPVKLEELLEKMKKAYERKSEQDEKIRKANALKGEEYKKSGLESKIH